MAYNFMRLFLAVVISFMALKSPLVNSESSEFPCVDITIPECQEVLPYNMTSNSQDQGDVRNRLLHILNSNHSCSHELIFMACAWNLPKCVTFSSSQIALPCRSLCEKLNSTCSDDTDREEFVRSLTNGVGCGTLPDIPTSEHHDLCQDYSQLIKSVENETSSSVILLSASQSEHIYAPSTSQLSIQDTMLSSPDANSIRIYPTPSISADTMATEGTGSLQATSGLNPTGGVPTSSAIPVATSTVNEVLPTAFMTSIGNIHSSTFRINPTPSISASTMATKGIGQSLQATSGLNPTGGVPTSYAVPIATSAVNEVSTSAFQTSIGNLHSSISATEKASILPSPSVTLRSSPWKQSSYFPDDNVISSVVPQLSSSITDTSVPSSAEPQFSSSALINPSQSVKPVKATPSLTSALLGSSTVYTSTDIGSSSENLAQSSTSVEFTPTNSSPIRNSVSVQFPPPPPPIPPFTLRSTSSLPSVSPVLASSSEQAPMQSSLSGVQTSFTESHAILPTPSGTLTLPASAFSTDRYPSVSSSESMVSLPFTSSHSSYDTAVFSTTPSSFHHVVASSVAIVTASQAMASSRFTSTHSIHELTHTPSPSVHVLSSSVALVTSSKSTLSMHHTPTPQIAQPPHTFLSSQSSASSSVVMVTAFESRVASYSSSTQLVSKQSQIFPSSSLLVTVKASSTSPTLTSLPTKLLNATEVPPTTEVYANNATQMVEIPAEKQKYKMILDGDCSKAMDNQRNFSQQFVKQLAKYFTVDKDKFEVEKVSCGSTIVDFTADISSNPNISMQLENMVEDGSFVFYYGGENFTMVDILTVTENPTPPVTDEPPTTPKAKSTKHGLTYDQQQFIIYVCLATVCGIAIIIAVAFCIQKYSKQCCRSRKKTFELVPEEHFVKLSDFNMAHTTIPRPKSIYEHNLDSNGKFKPYTNEEEEEHAADGNNGVAEHSCSVFTQTEGSLETVHIPQVMGSGQLSPDTKASQEFARNSVPVWDLPKLEGVVRQGEETESLTPVKRPSSGTFKEPITSPIIPSLPPPVPPPQPPPPPPPPAFMDPPTCSKSVQTGPVRTSDTFSELSDTSTVTDTRNLLQATKDGSPISAGVDNPAMIPDVDYVPRITPSDGLQ